MLSRLLFYLSWSLKDLKSSKQNFLSGLNRNFSYFLQAESASFKDSTLGDDSASNGNQMRAYWSH